MSIVFVPPKQDGNKNVFQRSAIMEGNKKTPKVKKARDNAEVPDMRKEIGLRISQARESKGLSQKDLSEIIGVKRETITQWENAARDIKTTDIVRLSDALNISCDYLLRGISANNIPIGEQLGLSEKAIETLKAIKRMDALYGISDKGCTKLISDIISLLEKSAEYTVFFELVDLREKNEIGKSIDEISTINDLKDRLISAGIGDADTLELITRCIKETDFQILAPFDVRNEKIEEILNFFQTVIFEELFPQERSCTEKFASAIEISSKFSNLKRRLGFDVDIEKKTIFDIEKDRREHANDHETE